MNDTRRHPRGSGRVNQHFFSSLAILWIAFGIAGVSSIQAEEWADRREEMMAAIRADVVATRSYIGKGSLNPEVLAVMGRVPRHAFVPADVRPAAYENRPLPIGFGQTISQPYIVALMTDLLEPRPEDIVLEVGTGSGYQAAVLAELVAKVYTIEIIPELARQAAERFESLGYRNITSRQGDGYFGWPDLDRVDGIVVTAAADHVPPPLVRQLKPGGRMVIPVGERFSVQHLLLITKGDDGKLKTRQVLPVRFVPLTGAH
jgi:protein-L-isoaspartate(D-aspartate) O-methyltransferase